MKGEQGVRREKENVREIWRLNCEQLAQHDAESVSKDAEIASLKSGSVGWSQMRCTDNLRAINHLMLLLLNAHLFLQLLYRPSLLFTPHP